MAGRTRGVIGLRETRKDGRSEKKNRVELEEISWLEEQESRMRWMKRGEKRVGLRDIMKDRGTRQQGGKDEKEKKKDRSARNYEGKKDNLAE